MRFLALALLLASPVFGQSFADVQMADLTVAEAIAGVDDCDDVAGLVAWYDAALGITEDVGVTTWEDQKGSFDFTQTTDADEPEYVDPCLSSLPCVRFDGVSDVMTASEMVDISGAVATFIVHRTQSSIVNKHIIGQADGGGTGRMWAAWFNLSGIKHTNQFGGGNHEGTTIVSTTQEYIVAHTYDGQAAGDIGVFVDGGSDESSETDTGEAADGAVAIGAHRDLTTSFTEVDLMEICIYDEVPSAQDRADLFTALNSKWAVY